MNNNLDLSKLTVSTDGRVQIGPGNFVDKNSISNLGYQMALNYQQTKDGGQATPGTAQGPANLSNTAVGTNPNAGTNANVPSSSASLALNQKANDAVKNVATADAPTSAQQRLMDYYGVGFDAVKNMDELSTAREFKALTVADEQKKAAETQKQQELSALAQKTASQNASEDANFQQLFKEYNRQRDQTMTTMTTKAFAANPFAGNSTAQSGYSDEINRKYDTLLTDLNAKYSAAKQSIAAGDMQAYSQIMKDAQSLVNTTTSQLTSQLNTVQDDIRQKGQFDLQMSKADQSNFMSMVKTFAGSPDLQKEVDTFTQTGKASPGLQEVLDRGAKAGLTPDETTSILKYQTDSERAVAFRQDMQTERLIMAQDRNAQAMREQNARANVIATSQNLVGKGIDPSSSDYAFGLGLASSGGSKLERAQVDKYGQIIQLTKQLADVKTSLQGVDKDKDLKNIILAHTGDSVQSLTSKDLSVLTAKINAMAAPIARSLYGEKGNLSEGDVERVLSSMPTGTKTADVRDALFNSMVKLVADSAVSNLQTDASAGRDVSGYVPYVQHLSETYKNNQIAPSGTIPDDIQAIIKKAGGK